MWGHWNPCFGLLVTSPLGFKTRVGNLVCAWWRCYTLPEIHLWCKICWFLSGLHGSWAAITCEQALVELETRTYCARDECCTNWAMPRILNGKRSGTSYMLLCVSTDCSAPSGSVAQDAYQNLYRAEHWPMFWSKTRKIQL